MLDTLHEVIRFCGKYPEGKYDNTILVLRSHIQEVLCMFNGEATDADVGDNATEDVTNDNAAVFRSIRKLDMTVEGFR